MASSASGMSLVGGIRPYDVMIGPAATGSLSSHPPASPSGTSSPGTSTSGMAPSVTSGRTTSCSASSRVGLGHLDLRLPRSQALRSQAQCCARSRSDSTSRESSTPSPRSLSCKPCFWSCELLRLLLLQLAYDVVDHGRVELDGHVVVLIAQQHGALELDGLGGRGGLGEFLGHLDGLHQRAGGRCACEGSTPGVDACADSNLASRAVNILVRERAASSSRWVTRNALSLF